MFSIGHCEERFLRQAQDKFCDEAISAVPWGIASRKTGFGKKRLARTKLYRHYLV
jgi:hypothetical protein